VEDMLDNVLPFKAENVQRRRFHALVGFEPELLAKVFTKYRIGLRIWRITMKDMMWTLSLAKSRGSLEVLAHLWKTTKSTFHRRTHNAADGMFHTINEVCQQQFVQKSNFKLF